MDILFVIIGILILLFGLIALANPLTNGVGFFLLFLAVVVFIARKLFFG